MTLPFDPQTGDIIFTREGSPASKLIRLRQQDFSYSHVFIVGRLLSDGRWTAFTTGAKNLLYYGELDLENYLKGKTYEVQRMKGGLKPEDKAAIITKAVSMRGAAYNTSGLLWLSTMALFIPDSIKSLFKPALDWPFVKMKSFFCSQAVAFIYWSGAMIRLNPRAGKLDPSPYDLATVFYADQTETIFKN